MTAKKLICTGVTGTAGFDAMRVACAHPGVAEVTAIARRKPNFSHPKLRFIELADFSVWPAAVLDQIHDHDGVLWCLGRSPIGITEQEFKHITCELFNSVVLELVKLIQAALAVFGMFDLDREARDGLLCDVTWEGIQRWVAEIGEPLLSVEVSLRNYSPGCV